jgi:hypothetical protein
VTPPRADLDGARPIRECPFCGSPGELENGFIYCTGPECSMHGMEADVWQNRRADTAAALRDKLDAARAGIAEKAEKIRVIPPEKRSEGAEWALYELDWCLALLAPDAGATAGKEP